MKTLIIARVAFQDNPTAEAVMLYCQKKERLSGWLEQDRTFYANIMNDAKLAEAMAGYGINPHKLRDEAALVEHVVAKNGQKLSVLLTKRTLTRTSKKPLIRPSVTWK